jgi:hypothetical protein
LIKRFSLFGAARICRMVLAEYVRDEVEGNLLSRAAQFSPAEADQVIEDFGYSGSAGLVADPQHESFHACRGEANRVADCYPGRILPRACPGNFIVCRDEEGWIE